MSAASSLLERIFFAVYGPLKTVYSRFSNGLGALILAVFIAMTAAVVIFFPVSNWDMFAYTAVILEPEIPDRTKLHDETYALVKQNVSDGEYITLTEDRDYRIRQAQDPAAFYTMLGFYRLKLGYVETARFLSRFMNPVEALRVISIAAAIAIGFLLLFWLSRYGVLAYGPLVAAMLVLCDFQPMVALLTPDLMAAFFVLLAGFLYVERQDLSAGLSLLAAVFIRPDHLAFIGVFFVFCLVYGPGRWVMTTTFILSAIAYKFLLIDDSHPGWWVHLWFTHVEYVPTLAGFHPDFSVVTYLEILVRSTVRSLTNQTWLALLFAEVIFFAKAIRLPYLDERPKVLLFAIFTSICAKYLVFPHFETRFYFPYLATMAMVLMTNWHVQQRGGRARNW